MFDKMIPYDLRNSFSKQTMPFNDQINSCSVYQKNATESHNNVSDTHKIGEYVWAGDRNWPWIRLCNYINPTQILETQKSNQSLVSEEVITQYVWNQ